MGFIENIKQCLGVDIAPLNPPFRAVIMGDCAIYLEGVKSIVFYQKEEIKLAVKGGALSIKGQELCVRKYCAGDIVVCGKICGIEKS